MILLCQFLGNDCLEISKKLGNVCERIQVCVRDCASVTLEVLAAPGSHHAVNHGDSQESRRVAVKSPGLSVASPCV